MVCFEDRLATEWYRIYQAMETIVAGQISKNLHIAVLFNNTRTLKLQNLTKN